MFKDETLDGVDIISDIKEDKYVRDQLCQTKTIEYTEKGSQAISRKDANVQTDFEQDLPQVTRMRVDNSKILSDFMLKVYPSIHEQLLANIRSHAFDNYEVNWDENEEQDRTSCLHTLNCNQQSQESVVTSLAWNATGSVIAAAFGSLDHESWCVHQSFIYLWNIDRANIDESKADRVIDSDVCLMSISFHSKHPGLLVGGDFSGKIYIWDMSDEENMLVAYSGKDVISHQEPITRIKWSSLKSSRNHELISVGTDGKILIWCYNDLKKSLVITKKFILRCEDIPRKFRHSVSSKVNLEIGITCLSFSHKNTNALYVGTENGNVLKCSTDSKLKGKIDVKGTSYNVPFIQAYKGHIGSVSAIEACPHKENIFLTCGSDKLMHIYSVQQQVPLMVIESCSRYFLTAEWSSFSTTVFFGSTKEGLVLAYNLLEDAITPVESIVVQKSNVPVIALCYNTKQRDIMATGDKMGIVKIWKVSDVCLQDRQEGFTYFEDLEMSDS